MALRSEQARVLRRSVIGGLIRNLVLFTAAFAVFCLAFQTFAVPVLADKVADATAVWRTLNSSEQFNQLITDQGLGADGRFADTAVEMEGFGYPGGEGTAADIAAELNDLSAAVETYAGEAALKLSQDAWGFSSDVMTDADLSDKVVTEQESGGSAAAGVNDGEYVEDAEPGSGVEDSSAPNASVPFVNYEEILSSFGLTLDTASAAQAVTALRASASIQELGITCTLPAGIEADQTALLASMALAGFDQEAVNTVIADAYRASQDLAYNAWVELEPADEAKALGISDDNPVWQILIADDGTYQMRDIALYTFIKSFKLPLAALLFVGGWLLIILRTLNRSFRYFDELSGAVATLLADKDAPIALPPDLSIARNELAVIQQQSIADERAAHAAEQRKNELVAYLAHDIRTPLTSVLGYLDLLRETTDLPRETLRRYADIAYTKAERLESLINEFFEITRYNLSAIPIERETVGVRLFCQQVAEAFFPEASARNIRISVDVAGAEQFFIDPDKLARALGNVLRNAVAYADANSTIAIAARQDVRTTTITVANRGREISAAHLETIFEKFYREDVARSSKSGGAGLGLAIAREIVVAHHGDIAAQSEQGLTVFTITLPTHGERDAPAPMRARHPGTTTPAPSAPSPAAAPTARPRPGTPASAPARATSEGTARLNPRYARHGRPPARTAVRDNGATKRIRPSRRHS